MKIKVKERDKQELPIDWKINNLEIKNFKSIKDLKISPARVNLFIGEPNAGKSNILEAMSLLQAEGENFKNLLRYESIDNLFYGQEIDKNIVVSTNLLHAVLSYNPKLHDFTLKRDDYKLDNLLDDSVRDEQIFIDYSLKINELGDIGEEDNKGVSRLTVKKYQFKDFTKNFRNSFGSLTSPFGDNLFSILQTNKELRQEVARFFTEQALELVLVIKDKDLVIQRKKDDLVFQLPYSLSADTFQRMIFHFAAIHSNQNAVILFEEPENHSFPPYIKDLGLKISQDIDNQYFIATHSHYVLESIIEKTPMEDVAIFITYVKDYETKVRLLTSAEISEIQKYGVNIFFNLNHFINA